VSRAHARLERRDGGYVVLDLGSTNLTRVNGEIVHERVLRDGDEVRFGRALCRFVVEAPEAAGI
jgi:pSer/pThr/pTyr-binding forkhead associated (FHA) protein